MLIDQRKLFDCGMWGEGGYSGSGACASGCGQGPTIRIKGPRLKRTPEVIYPFDTTSHANKTSVLSLISDKDKR